MKPAAFRVDGAALVRNLVLACVGIELMWFALDYRLNYAGGAGRSEVRRLLNTAAENSIPGWFSIIQTVFVALVLWGVYAVVRQTGTRWQRLGWFGLAGFLSYLAIDDGAQIHESLGTGYHDVFSADGATGSFGAWTLELFPSYRWQIVFMPAFALMGVFMFVFLMRELRGWLPRVAVTLALACLGGAVMLDFFEGLDPAHAWNPYTAITQTWHLDYWSARNFGTRPYDTLLHFSKSIEECMEMFAMTLLLSVFLNHLTQVGRWLEIRFEDAPAVHEVPASADSSRPTTVPFPVKPREHPRAA